MLWLTSRSFHTARKSLSEWNVRRERSLKLFIPNWIHCWSRWFACRLACEITWRRVLLKKHGCSRNFCLVWDPKAHCRFKRAFCLSLTWTRRIHCHFLYLSLIYTHAYVSQVVWSLQAFRLRFCMHVLSLSCMLHATTIHSPSFSHSEYCLVKITNY
jgi:hypothetical protein